MKVLLLIVSLMSTNLPFLAKATMDEPQGSCPSVEIKIQELTITPTTAAAQHIVKVVWFDNEPSCFDHGSFHIQGTVTFRNGETRSFSSTIDNESGQQGNVEIQVAGVNPPFNTPNPVQTPISRAPQKVAVRIDARLQSSVTGDNISLTLPGGSICPARVNVQVTNMQVTTVHASGRPGNDFYPQVKVDWLLSNTRSCFVINNATVTATLKIGGKTYQEKKSATGTGISSLTLLFDSVAVGSNFVPDQITALVEVSGTALMTGSTTKDLQVN